MKVIDNGATLGEAETQIAEHHTLPSSVKHHGTVSTAFNYLRQGQASESAVYEATIQVQWD